MARFISIQQLESTALTTNVILKLSHTHTTAALQDGVFPAIVSSVFSQLFILVLAKIKQL